MAYSEDTAHPRPLAWFLERRDVTTAFTQTIVDEKNKGKNHILVNAPVKSGKKDIVEILRQLTADTVVYATSLNRKDVKRQKTELNEYGVRVHVIDNDAHCRDAIADINTHTGIVYLCIDECDYGSGDKQKMSALYTEFVDEPNVIKVYFSATSHETEASSLSQRSDFTYLKYNPPPEYHGAKYFLDEDLVIDDVDSFFELDEDTGDILLTEHGVVVIRESINNDRHIGVVRVTNKKIPMKDFKKTPIKRSIEAQLKAGMPESRNWEIVPIDASDSHDWEDRRTRISYVNDMEQNILFIIKQTCTRGTDLKGWHHRLAFWHDARSHHGCSRPNTLIQAFLRPSHYGNPQAIRLYVDKLVVELAAYDDMEAWIKGCGKPPTRTKREKTHLNKTSEISFNTVAEAKQCAISMGYSPTVMNLNHETMTFQYRGKPRIIQLENVTRNSADIGWGLSIDKKQARIMPVLADDSSGNIRHIVNYPIINEDALPIHATQKSMYEL